MGRVVKAVDTVHAAARTVTDRLVEALRSVADRIDGESHGTAEIEWRDGVPQIVRVTTKHKA